MTAGSRWDRISSLFDEALELPAGERAAWLARACEGDEGVRREVSRMLAAHDRAEGILEQPVVTPAEDLLQHLREALADRYAIEHEIGRGGSATIFVAHERKHGRRVVLKVLNPEVAAFFGADRFQREVRIAARLAHPHILGLIDSGSADGLLYYVMPYVQGETLRARLAREGRIPLAESIVLLRDIADALSYAHRAGIVHRDLKPENVLCVGGHAFLMDFGVAMLLTPVAGDDHVTSPGSSVGTPAYMAPEQVNPDRRVDHRVDLFAWGLLAHEVLTGRLPTDPEEPAIAALCPEAPPELVRLVAGCLAIDPAKRIERAEALVADLEHLSTLPVATVPAPARRRTRRWIVPIGLTVAAAIAVFLLSRARAGDEPPVATIPIRSPVAVAALANETGDSSLAVWGRMAGDWITQGLQETGLVTVVPWPSARRASDRVNAERATGRPVDAVAVLREETGAKTVVTGSYYLVGDSLRFRVEVSDAQEARVLGALPPISVSRGEPERAIGVLRDRLMGSVAIWTSDRFARMPGLTRIPPSFDAYRAFDAGMQRFVDQRYDESAPEFQRAFDLDSSFVVALLYTASAWWNTDEYARADSAIRAVRRHDAALSEYHRRWLEFFEAMLAGNVEAALAAARQASSLAPESRMSFLLAQTALMADRAEEARAVLESVDPDKGELRGWSSYWTQLAHARHMLGDHAGERRSALAMRERHPDRRVALALEARALAAEGKVAAIDSILARDRALPPNTYWSQGAAMVVAGEELVAHGHAEAGRTMLRRGIAWLAEQRQADSTFYGHRFWLGSAHYALGEWAAARALLTDLATFMPERQRYRGLAALASAQAGAAVDDSALGPELPYQRGEHVLFRARLAAVRGDTPRALALASEALKAGVDGLSWIHASAYQDLSRLGPRLRELPRAMHPVPATGRRPSAPR